MSFKTAGRGRKKCGACGLYVGVRSLKCECGAAFSKKANPAVKTASTKKVTPVVVKVAPVKIKTPTPVVIAPVVVTPETAQAQERALGFLKRQARKSGDCPSVVVWALPTSPVRRGFNVPGEIFTREFLRKADKACRSMQEEWAKERRATGELVFVRGV